MPLPLPLEVARFAASVLKDGFRDAANEALDKFSDFTRDFIKHVFPIPHPLLILDDITLLLTGWTGILVTLPLAGLKRKFVDFLRRFKIHNKLLTLEGAVDGFFQAQIEFVRDVTGTSSNTFTTAIAFWFARFAWHWFKRIKFLRALFNVNSEAELIEVFLKKIVSKLTLLRIVVTWLAAAFALTNLVFLISIYAVAFEFQAVVKKILPQNSPRRYVSFKKKHQKRESPRRKK